MTQNLTDAEIDGLSGDALRDAIAYEQGWTKSETGYWYKPGEHEQPFRAWASPAYTHTDLGGAMKLLMGCKGVAVNITDTMVQVITGLTAADLLAMGPKESAAETICRAYLKFKNRGV